MISLPLGLGQTLGEKISPSLSMSPASGEEISLSLAGGRQTGPNSSELSADPAVLASEVTEAKP